MPFPELSPYEILDITPDTPSSGLMAAYQRAVKARRYPPARLSQAFSELRNVRKRAEHDLLSHARPADGDAAGALLADLPAPDFVAGVVGERPPLLPLGIAPGSLDPEQVVQDFAPVLDCPLTLQATDVYRQADAVLPRIQFPS
jgi:hypothetical protein